jgi:hypothetical protein
VRETLFFTGSNERDMFPLNSGEESTRPSSQISLQGALTVYLIFLAFEEAPKLIL